MQGGADALHAEQNMRRPTLDNHILCSLDASVDSGSLDTLLNVIITFSSSSKLTAGIHVRVQHHPVFTRPPLTVKPDHYVIVIWYYVAISPL